MRSLGPLAVRVERERVRGAITRRWPLFAA
jgi:hypothetical protein